MKKAIIVEYNFMTRIVIDEDKENLDTIVKLSKDKILEKVENELAENLSKWYDDEEMSYSQHEDMANFAVWIKDNFSDEIAGAFARRSDGKLYWDEQVDDLVKLWYENYR